MRKTNKLSQAENIRQYLKKYPGKSVSEVAHAMGIKYQIVYMTKRGMEDREKKLAEQTITVSAVDTPMQIEMFEPAADPVNHPAHCTRGAIECIDAMEAALGRDAVISFCQGNAFKYAWRAGQKGDRAEDLRKAAWYANRAADLLDRRYTKDHSTG